MMRQDPEARMREDRMMRDAALALVKADISNLKADYSAQGIGTRFASRMAEGATDVFEEAVDVADDNKGVLATLIAAVILWFARNPIMSLFDDDNAPDDRPDDDPDLFGDYEEPDAI
ncbi:hypothetical protein GRI43_04750 [Altererythrobacter luteolus]|uniref:Uncharacterized protein n=1 Tax=Pontixanthobacter luteolus TaxID=295089 RepID=A0A6I4UYM3_9SPHN|nr:hypothetical protein [Pontixanthobacter luteolus]MXP46703.1 hypothetical protein [Pontixanthobacter luteolus]